MKEKMGLDPKLRKIRFEVKQEIKELIKTSIKEIKMINKGLLTSMSQDWRTPKDLYHKLDQEFKFDFDPCPNNPNFDGLNIEWGKSNYINPPYTTKLQDSFIKKALEESQKGKLCVLLIPSRTGTKRFHNHILPYAKEIRFLQDRLCFNDSGKRAPFDSMIIIFDGRELRH